MADIVIRGIEMPLRCINCPFEFYLRGENICRANGGKKIEFAIGRDRGTNCPLAPLPEGHGRMIDADALESIIGGFSLNWEYGQGVSDCWDALISAPTILEAEEGRAET